MAGKLIPTATAAQRLDTPESTLRYWRHIGFGPPSFKLGRHVVYDEVELELWIAAQRDAARSS